MQDSESSLSLAFLEVLFGDYPQRDFQIRLWDGTIWGARKRPRFILVLKHAGALHAMFYAPSELALGEAYVRDDFSPDSGRLVRKLQT